MTDAALAPPIPIATVAALIVRRGVANLCADLWEPKQENQNHLAHTIPQIPRVVDVALFRLLASSEFCFTGNFTILQLNDPASSIPSTKANACS